MKLKNAVTSREISIPVEFKDKITVMANDFITALDVRMFRIALNSVKIQLQKDNIDVSLLPHANVIFTRDGSFTLEQNENHIYGYRSNIIVYCMERLHYVNIPNFTFFIFIEELTHHYWNIEDEIEVKYKVLEIIGNSNVIITIDDLKKWGLL